MAKAKLDVSTVMTIVIAGAAFAGGATYLAKLGNVAEQDLPGFFAQLRWIILFAAAVSLVVGMMLARRFDEIAAKTEAQHRFPPQGYDALAGGVAAPCDGEAALMIAARLRGFALLSLCLGIAAALSGLLFAFRF